MNSLNQSVHLVGSVPLADTAEVFDTVCEAFGSHLRRISDGETGERTGWISFQRKMLLEHPAMMLDPAGRAEPFKDLQGNVRRRNHLLVLREGETAVHTTFLPLGYAAAALESYAIFAKKRADGIIPAHVRFQVSLPTPFATGLFYVHPKSQRAFVALMKAALLAEMRQICDAIPHNQLAIQWDCCQEILLAEGYFPADWAYQLDELFPTLGELGDAVPTDVHLGYHLCYGSPVDEPLMKQDDMAVVVRFTNDLVDTLTRPLNFIHLPVSDPQADDAFFAPLADLDLRPPAELYLGLINPRDAGGDQRRMVAARAYFAEFGVATECGWGRKNRDRVQSLLAEHLEALG
ncbi:MAG: hypothetical protein AAF614_12155 [Chloroflexota bacterium]